MRKSTRKFIKRYKKIIFIIVSFILTIILFITVKGMSSSKGKETVKEKQTFKNRVINNTNEIINKDLEVFIEDFFNSYYKSMKELKSIDMKNYFSKNSKKDYYIYQASIDTLINSRKSQKNDLSLDDCYYDLTFNLIEESNKEYKIDILEDGYFKFNYIKKITSKTYNILNSFVLVKEKNNFKIKSYKKDQDFYTMIDLIVDKELSDKDFKTSIDSLVDKYSRQIDRMHDGQLDDFESYIKNKNIGFKKCDNKYAGKKAAEFAKQHVTKKTESYYEDYNSQNMVSWALVEGDIPMDYKGYYLWKHYDSWLDEYNTKEGRTASFIDPTYFYNYALKNDEYGLCSEVDVNSFYGEIGDVVILGFNKDYYQSSMVIDVIKDKDGNVIDLLLASNNMDAFDYPLSAYVYPIKTLIKIIGWNN